MIFQRISTVEARKYEGPRIAVIHDQIGEQSASSGDYLLGTERGKIEVMSAEKFEAQFKFYEPNADQQELSDTQAKLAGAEAQISALTDKVTATEATIAQLSAANAVLVAAQEDVNAQKSIVHDLSVQLALEKGNNAVLQGKLDDLIAAEKAQVRAQATIEKAQSDIPAA